MDTPRLPASSLRGREIMDTRKEAERIHIPKNPFSRSQASGRDDVSMSQEDAESMYSAHKRGVPPNDIHNILFGQYGSKNEYNMRVMWFLMMSRV